MEQFEALEEEQRILRYLFDNTYVQRRVMTHLKPEYFSDESCQRLVKNINFFTEKYEKFPDPRTFYTMMRQGETRDLFVKLMKTDVGSKDSEEVQDIVEQFFRTRMALNILRTQIQSIHEGDIDKIGSLIDDMRESVNFKIKVDIGIDIDLDNEEVLRRMQIQAGAIPSALQSINDFTRNGRGAGGWYRKAVSLYMGQANVGKSILLCNEAVYAYRCGYRVLYISLELSEEMTWQRIMANACDIPFLEIDKEFVDDDELKQHADMLSEKKEGNKLSEGGRLILRQIPNGSRTIDIEQVIDEASRVKNIEFDLVVVDYMGEMSGNPKTRADKRHEELGMILRQLRNLAVRKNVAILTASQVNGEGYDTTDVSMKNVSESKALNHVADFIVTLTQDSLLKENKMYHHRILKNRFGPKDETFYSRVWFEYMRVKDATLEQVSELASQAVSAPKQSKFNNDDDGMDFIIPKG